MRHRFAFLVPVALFTVVAAVPAGAAQGGISHPATCAKAAPAAGSLAPFWLVTAAPADKHTYCYDSRAACDNAQKQASGTKSACYKSGTQYCYDLFTAAAGDPEPTDP